MFEPKLTPGVSPGDDWAAMTDAIVVRGSEVIGTILVRRKLLPIPKEGRPPILLKWKLPGGRKNPGEGHPLLTAHRELFEETHLTAPLEDFCHVATWLDERRVISPTGQALVTPHWKSLFRVRISDREAGWANGNHPKNGGVEPRYFSNQEFAQIFTSGEFMPAHRKALLKFNLMSEEGIRIDT